MGNGKQRRIGNLVKSITRNWRQSRMMRMRMRKLEEKLARRKSRNRSGTMTLMSRISFRTSTRKIPRSPDSHFQTPIHPETKPTVHQRSQKQARNVNTRNKRRRKQLEALVDSKMDLVIPTKSKQTTLFHYRETSPTTFGLTARDILMAPDASLNEFAGLKK